MKTLLTSRKFWFLILTLLALILGQFVSSFNLDAETATGLVVIAVSYMVGAAVDPGPGGWKGVLLSRKFWTAAIGFVVMILHAFGLALPFGMTEDTLILIALAIGGFITSVAFEKPKKV